MVVSFYSVDYCIPHIRGYTVLPRRIHSPFLAIFTHIVGSVNLGHKNGRKSAIDPGLQCLLLLRSSTIRLLLLPRVVLLGCRKRQMGHRSPSFHGISAPYRKWAGLVQVVLVSAILERSSQLAGAWQAATCAHSCRAQKGFSSFEQRPPPLCPKTTARGNTSPSNATENIPSSCCTIILIRYILLIPASHPDICKKSNSTAS